MRSRFTSALLLALALSGSAPFVAVPTWAQEAEGEMPPMPRPRPDPESAPAAPQGTTPATSAIDQATSAPQTVALSARITQDGAPIPDGMVWRIFDTEPDATGELALVAKSELGAPTVQLPPGDYVVHLAYGRAQTSQPLSVTVGSNEQAFVLEAGALRLNSAVTGDVAIPPDLLRFDIFTEGEENQQALIAEALRANEIVTLNAGTYHIVSHFGSINAVVRADLRVEPGQLTDATLFHHASQVSFKLVSEPGGEAIADVEWTVNAEDGTTLFTELGAFPTTVLAEGDYVVLAKQGEQVFDREFQVQPGAAREYEVLTAVY